MVCESSDVRKFLKKSKFQNFSELFKVLYTRYPIVARALGLAAAFRPSASREQRYLAYNLNLKLEIIIARDPNMRAFTYDVCSNLGVSK